MLVCLPFIGDMSMQGEKKKGKDKGAVGCDHNFDSEGICECFDVFEQLYLLFQGFY